MYQYLNLAIGAPARLQALKRAALQRPGHTWRDVRYSTFKTASGAWHAGKNGTESVYCMHGDNHSMREMGAAEQVNHIRHTGWYTDPYGENTMRGIVISLPHARYLAGYVFSMNDERVIRPQLHTDKVDAAYMADEHARVAAEREMEYRTRWQEGQRLHDKVQDAMHRLRECRVLRHRDARYTDEAHECIERIRMARLELSTNYSDMEY